MYVLINNMFNNIYMLVYEQFTKGIGECTLDKYLANYQV